MDPHADRNVLLAGHLLFAVLLTLGTVRAVLAASPSLPGVASAAAGAAAAAGWYGAGALWATRRPGPTARVWLAGLIVIWLALVVISAEYIWLAFLLAILVWHLFPVRWAIASEVAIAAVAVTAFALHQGHWVTGAVIGPVIGIGVAAVITEIYQRLRAQSEERRRLLDELVRTQRALAAREREAGRLAEREHLARGIHDTVGQALASVILLLRAAPTAPENERRTQLSIALQTATAALADTRRLVRGHETDGPAEGLAGALTTLATESSRLGLPTDFARHGRARPLPTPVEVALLRAAQEALSNARKHSGAGRAAVTLTFQDDEVSVDVVDDGAGFDPTVPAGLRPDGSGFGLTSMRGRIQERGGELTIESGPGAGAAIRATVPTAPGLPTVPSAGAGDQGTGTR